jgi:hypothetical protein
MAEEVAIMVSSIQPEQEGSLRNPVILATPLFYGKYIFVS